MEVRLELRWHKKMAQNWHRICTLSCDIEVCHSFRRSSRRNVQNFLVPGEIRERDHEKLHSIQQTGPHEQQDSHVLQDRNMSHTDCMGNAAREAVAGSFEKSRDRIMELGDAHVQCKN